MPYPTTIPPTPQGYDLQQNVRGHFGGYYNSAHYEFLYQGGFDSPVGDEKIHAMKSTDGGNTWVEQDSAHAPSPTVTTSYGSAYNVSLPDGNTVWVTMMNAASSSVITSFSLQSYDLATDTWNSPGGTYSVPALAFYGGSSPANSICVMDVIVRGAGDYVFQFNGATETVSGSHYGRVYVCSFDGTTYGTPMMLPGQTGVRDSFTATRGAVDSNGITHFWLNNFTGSAGLQDVYHVAMAAGTVGTFGSVSTLTSRYQGFHDPGTLSEPTIDVVSSVETLAIAMEVKDPATSVSAYSFFSAAAVLNPSWTADPGVIITEDPTLLDSNGGNDVFDISVGIAYYSGVYYFSFLASQSTRSSIFGGAMYNSQSTDGGATWSTPALLWSAPVVGTSALTAASQQMLTYPFAAGIAIVGMFVTYDNQGEIAQFYIPGSSPAPSVSTVGDVQIYCL